MLQLNQLIGFGAAASGVTSVSFLASATTTGTNVTIPATVQPGDYLIFWNVAGGAGTPTAVLPSGFTEIISNTSISGLRAILSEKIAESGDAGAVRTGMNGSDFEEGVLLAFRPDAPITDVTGDANIQGTTGTPTNQVLSVTGSAPMIMFGAYEDADGSGGVDPRGFSPAKDGEANPNNFCYLAYKIYNNAPSATTLSMQDEGSGNVLASASAYFT